MADIRIKDMDAASAVLADDFVMLDSPTAGTRKVRASNLVTGGFERLSVLDGWSQAAALIGAGLADVYFPVGSRVTERWADVRPGNTAEYDMAFNAVHNGTGKLGTGEEIPVAYLQTHRVLPFDTPFSDYQAFACFIDGLPAGTYNVTMPDNYGNDTMKGKTYQFTLTKALPAGGQLAGFRQISNAYAASMLTVYAYASATDTTAQETVTASQGTAGASLGTFSIAGVPVPASGTPATKATVEVGGTAYEFYGLNSIHRVAWGNNRWLHSGIRQFLNATGSGWWKPATVFDRPPSYVGYDGFLTGLSEEFTAHMQPVAQVTALNYVTDGGTSAEPLYDTTYDKVFLPSGRQHNLQATAAYGGAAGLEGEPWEYWRRVAGTASPLAWSSWDNESTYHPEYVQYDLASPATPRIAWVRSAHRGSGYTVACVYSQGTCNNNHAYNGFRVAPACAIG